MAVLASRTQLPAMKVRVAIGALGANVGKDARDVAVAASDVLVHASQSEARLIIVIKLRNRANGSPACGGVAILAGNLYVAVRILRLHTLGPRAQTAQRKKGGKSYQPLRKRYLQEFSKNKPERVPPPGA
jgi:hypothetical protein